MYLCADFCEFPLRDELQLRREQLDKEKETLEKDRKAFQKRCKAGAAGSGTGGGGADNVSSRGRAPNCPIDIGNIWAGFLNVLLPPHALIQQFIRWLAQRRESSVQLVQPLSSSQYRHRPNLVPPWARCQSSSGMAATVNTMPTRAASVPSRTSSSMPECAPHNAAGWVTPKSRRLPF